MKNIKAVFMKQILDTLKNKTVFIQFLMFPVIAVNFVIALVLFAVAYKQRGLD